MANVRMDKKLDFIGLGVQRSATTWLFESLETHPQIKAARQGDNKELHFFNQSGHYAFQEYPRETADLMVSFIRNAKH